MADSEPPPRFWHQAVSHRNQVYLWGGRTKDESKDSEHQQQLKSTVESFNPIDEEWRSIRTKGNPHVGFSQLAYASVGGIVYIYGSTTKEGGESFLSQLKINDDLVWSQLWTSTEDAGTEYPMLKDACGMVCIGETYDELALFGGFGPPPPHIQEGSSFEKFKKMTLGWTNECHVFNIKKRMFLVSKKLIN